MFNKDEWIGRTFRCTVTGELFTIPKDVSRGRFYSFGESFIDVGDGYYSRRSTTTEEVKDLKSYV